MKTIIAGEFQTSTAEFEAYRVNGSQLELESFGDFKITEPELGRKLIQYHERCQMDIL